MLYLYCAIPIPKYSIRYSHCICFLYLSQWSTYTALISSNGCGKAKSIYVAISNSYFLIISTFWLVSIWLSLFQTGYDDTCTLTIKELVPYIRIINNPSRCCLGVAMVKYCALYDQNKQFEIDIFSKI